MTEISQELAHAADQLGGLTSKINRLINNPSDLSASGQATAIAMIVVMNFHVLNRAEGLLRVAAQAPAIGRQDNLGGGGI